MFREAFESFSSSLSERIVNPFTGSFLLSWPFWNYKLILIVFSDAKVQVKISLISSFAYSNWQSAVLFGVFFPAFTALAYIYIYPFPSRWFVRHSLEQKKKLNSLRQEIDNETLLTKEESDRLKRKYNAGARELEDELEEKNSLISEMREAAAKVSEGNTELHREHRKLKSDLEIMSANFAEVSNKLRGAQDERDAILKANQNMSLQSSSLQGTIAAMNNELTDLKKIAHADQELLKATTSDLATKQHELQVLQEQKKELDRGYKSLSNYSDDLDKAILNFLQFTDEISAESDMPIYIRRRAKELSGMAQVVRL